MMDNPNLIRNVALAGQLHHGKVTVRQSYCARGPHAKAQTTFMDMLIEETHAVGWSATSSERPARYTGSFSSLSFYPR